MNKRVLITGISGFTGSYVAREFTDLGCDVYGLSYSGNKELAGVKQIYPVSLVDNEGLSRVINTVKPHYVVHLAGIAFVAHDNIGELYETNVVGVRNLLEALKASKTKPESVIIVSSANVYGDNNTGLPLCESTPLSPVSDYAVTKVASELVSSLYAKEYPITIVRPFNYTGRFQSAQFLVPKIIAAAKKKLPVIELGNLDIARDFSDVRDVARFYSDLIQKPINGDRPRVVNICSGRAYTLQEILTNIEIAAGHEFSEVRVNPAFVRANEIKLLIGNPSLLNASVTNVNRFTLEQTIEWMVDCD